MLSYLKFHFKHYFCAEEHRYTTRLIFSFIKKSNLKNQKKIINVKYLMIVLIKMKLLTFLVFSQYELAFKYGISFPTPIYIWI